MAETLTLADGSLTEPIDLETIRSRFIELSKERISRSEPADSSISDHSKLLEDHLLEYQEIIKKIEIEDSKFAALGNEGSDLCLEYLKKEIYSMEGENAKLSSEINGLTYTVARDTNKLDRGLEELDYMLKSTDSDGQSNGRLGSMDLCEIQKSSIRDNKFEMLKLDRQIEESECRLKIMQDIDSALEGMEVLGQTEFMLTGAKIIEYKDDCIRVFLKAPRPDSSRLIFGQKFDFDVENCLLDHELLIEVGNDTMELKNVEIFPDDVSIDGIVDILRSSREFQLTKMPLLGWFIRLVQHHILLSNIRRSLIKDANKSRHYFEYLEREMTVKVRLAGEIIDAFIKVPPNWPFSYSSGLIIISIKSSGSQSATLSLSFLSRIKERANSLDCQTRGNLVRFVDAIEEILLREMQSQLHST